MWVTKCRESILAEQLVEEVDGRGEQSEMEGGRGKVWVEICEIH